MSVDRMAAWGCTAVVIVAVAVGLILAGSPGEQRLTRLDKKRVGDLAMLARGVDGYWEAYDQLPAHPNQLLDGRRLSHMPSDPTTGMAYEYKVTAIDGYQLCARFDRPSPRGTRDEFWVHESGRQCFSFRVPTESPE